MEAFFAIKSYPTLSAQLIAKLSQIQSLLEDQDQWEAGCALLCKTIIAVYSKGSEYSHVSAPAEAFACVRKAMRTGPLLGTRSGNFRHASLETIDTSIFLLSTFQQRQKLIGFSPYQIDRISDWMKSAQKYRTRLLQQQVTSESDHINPSPIESF